MPHTKFAIEWIEADGVTTGFRIVFYPNLPVNRHNELRAKIELYLGTSAKQQGHASGGETCTYMLSRSMRSSSHRRVSLGMTIRRMLGDMALTEMTN